MGSARVMPDLLRRARRSGLALLSLALLSAPLAAQAATPPPTTSTVTAVRSPRVAMTDFLELTSRANFAGAARFLEMPADEPEAPQRAAAKAQAGQKLEVDEPPVQDPDRAAELARKLKVVLDHRLWIDLDTLSDLPTGNPADGLPGRTDVVGRITAADGRLQPVLMVRRGTTEPRWMFAAETVARIEGWYDDIDHRLVLDWLPDVMLRSGPRALAYWQWVMLPLLLIVAVILGTLMRHGTQLVVGLLVKRTQVGWDDVMLKALAGPIMVAWSLLGFYLLLPVLAPTPPGLILINGGLRGAALALLFWTASRVIDVTVQIAETTPWAKARPSSRSLLPLGSRVAKVALGIVAVVVLLSELGYAVGSLLAGLGIGGLAVALAAQKTVENLIGAFAIGADQPFREGDFVKIEDFTGTVERIGLRSTRIRTADRTVISLPNGRLADMRLETFASRDRLRFSTQVQLAQSTSPAQVRAIRERIDALLRGHARVWQEGIMVRLTGLGEWSLTMEVSLWVNTTDGDAFNVVREEVLLAILDIVAEAGAGLAVPARAIVSDGPRLPAAPLAAGPAAPPTPRNGHTRDGGVS